MGGCDIDGSAGGGLVTVSRSRLVASSCDVRLAGSSERKGCAYGRSGLESGADSATGSRAGWPKPKEQGAVC